MHPTGEALSVSGNTFGYSQCSRQVGASGRHAQSKQSSSPGQGLGTNIVYNIIASHPFLVCTARVSIWVR